jgi:hypothetical protein
MPSKIFQIYKVQAILNSIAIASDADTKAQLAGKMFVEMLDFSELISHNAQFRTSIIHKMQNFCDDNSDTWQYTLVHMLRLAQTIIQWRTREDYTQSETEALDLGELYNLVACIRHVELPPNIQFIHIYKNNVYSNFVFVRGARSLYMHIKHPNTTLRIFNYNSELVHMPCLL